MVLDTHACALPGCREACPTSHLMCVDHWRMVPAALRVMVRMAYQVWRRAVSGNRSMEMKVQRAAELRKVQQMAVAAVTEKLVKKDLNRQESQDRLFEQ
jgi:hypothetical protein